MKVHRRQATTTFRRVAFGVAALAFMLFTPGPYAFADTTSSSTSTCSPVAAPPTGIIRPTGDDAGTYTYNSCTGLWENAYYTWNPATQTATPKTPLVYACNTKTWQWITKIWVYDPASVKFIQVGVSVSALPSGAIVATTSINPCTPPVLQTTTAAPTSSGSTTTGTTSAAVNTTTAAQLTNQINNTASTGTAAVTNNTLGGDATSGNALTVANILNAVQSSSVLSSGAVTTFVKNIDGNVQGNLIIDPSQLQPASSSDPLTNNNLTVNAQTSGQITNNITLASASGNANVSGNTTAGNATSGSAATVADVVNMLNSIISAGKSFVGVININGDMHGDILMPQSFLNSLVASNVPRSTVTLSSADASQLGINATNNLATTNNVTSSAATGNATVADNTAAGNATTGTAGTKVTVFNLTGSQVIGANCLLVFVNVSGTWVGVIMNAPAGSTAAAFGSGITANDVNTALVNATTNNAITNNINVAAKSGDASVRDNTSAGNATSGNANTAVNLLNMNGSQFSLSGWFGILFINIFGNWYGSFGVYTPPVTPGAAPAGSPSVPSPIRYKVFQFVPMASAAPAAQTSAPSFTTVGAHLADTTSKVLGAVEHTVQPPAASANGGGRQFQAIAGILLAIGLGSLVADRIMYSRSARGGA